MNHCDWRFDLPPADSLGCGRGRQSARMALHWGCHPATNRQGFGSFGCLGGLHFLNSFRVKKSRDNPNARRFRWRRPKLSAVPPHAALIKINSQSTRRRAKRCQRGAGMTAPHWLSFSAIILLFLTQICLILSHGTDGTDVSLCTPLRYVFLIYTYSTVKNNLTSP